ncbi:MAG: hypothetical protein FD181_3583, partial [Prolixibacteraceae bacterium]
MENIYKNRITENASVWQRFLVILALAIFLVAGTSFNGFAQYNVTGDDNCAGNETVIGLSGSVLNNHYHLLRKDINGNYTWITSQNGQGSAFTYHAQITSGIYEVWQYNPYTENTSIITSNIAGKQSGEVFIYANPVPEITGEANPCYKTSVTYSTASGMNTYFWTVANGTIGSVQGTNQITVNWDGVSGAASVSVTYTDANGCNNTANPTVYPVNVKYPVYIGATGYATLQAAITAAATGAEIDLVCNHTEGLVTVNKAVTIDGNGNTLTSTSTTYGLEISSAGVTVKNITVDNPETYGILAHESNNLNISNTTVKNCGTTGSGTPFASGFAINCSDNITLTNIVATNNEGNGISITDCDGVTINGITTSGNSFGTFGAGIGIFSGGEYCTPAGSSNVTVTGIVSISEVPAIYEQVDAGGGAITTVAIPSSFTHYLGFNSNKYYYTSEAAALNAADLTLQAYPVLQPAVYVKEMITGNLTVKSFTSTTMSIQAAINAAASGKSVTVGDGTFAENIVANKPIVLNGANAGVVCGSRTNETVISPASGIPVSITSNGVTINGFEITTASSVSRAIVSSGISDLVITYNNIHDVGSAVSGENVYGLIYSLGSATATNVTVNYNCFNNIGNYNNHQKSNGAIGFLDSNASGTLSTLKIENNSISNVFAKTADWITLGGRIAYGIQINVGGSSSFLTTGKVVSASIKNNNISNLTGFIATGIALEGNTENAMVEANTVANLTGYKLANRASGGYDLNGLKFENNRYVSTVTVQNNSFQTNTFNYGTTSNLGYAVANYVPVANGGIAQLGCNWYGTANYGELVAEYTTFKGKIFSKAGAGTDFVNYSTVASPINCLGINATPASLNVAYDHAGENVVVTFDVTGNSSAMYPIPGLTTQAAALEIGDDIITEYYYMDGANKVYLKTAGGNDLVKNKYWDKYLNNTSTSNRYPDFSILRFIVPVGNYSTSTNPLTGGTVTNGWLAPVYGKDLYVTVTFLHNGEVTTATQSVAIPAAPVVNLDNGRGYLQIQTAIKDPLTLGGHTIQVAAGTFVEVGQIVIDKNLTIVGADKTTTIIKPAADLVDWFLVNSGVSLNLSKVKLDGTGRAIKRALNIEGSGVVDNCWFTQIKGASKYDYGTGVQVKNPAKVDVINCVFDNIGRTGIRHEGTGTVSGNTYTGKGAGDWLDYFILAEYGCDITIDGNTVTNCIGVATLDGSTSSAIAVWDDPNTKTNIINNILTNNSTGIGFAGINSTDPSYSWPQATIGTGNVITGGDYGVQLGAWSGSKYNPTLTFGSTTLKGQAIQAIAIAENIGIGNRYNISTVIIQNSGGTTITDNYAKEDLVIHAIDAGNRGLFVWNANNVYVTTASFVTPATTTPSIQRGVDAALATWTVNVNNGTYNENVVVNKNGLNLKGAGAANTILTPSNACNGIGIAILASDVKVKDLKVANFGTGLTVAAAAAEINGVESVSNCSRGMELFAGTTNLKVLNSKINNNSVTGIFAGTDAGVDGLTIENSEIKNNVFGIENYQSSTAPLDFKNVTIKNSNISDNSRKGIYVEKLSEALLTGLTMANNGTDVTCPWNNGIDINLKYKAYSNITIQNSEFSNSGHTGTATLDDNPVVIAIKARDDSPSYNTVPASLDNVIIKNNIISGPQNGIRLGEFGKTNTGPTNVTVTDNDLSATFANKALINNTKANITANCNWWGAAASAAIAAKIGGLGTGVTNYNPWVTVAGDGAGIGFQPTGVCDGSPVAGLTAVPTHILCGPTTGSILVSWTGGSKNYTVSWSPGSSATGITGNSYQITPLAAGKYTITVTDANESSVSTSTEIEVKYLPVTNTTDGLYFATIQEAINAATTENGETIEICQGTYSENVVVNKELTIQGNTSGTKPVINGTSAAQVVLVSSPNVKLDYLEIQFNQTTVLNGIKTGSSGTFNNLVVEDCHIVGVGTTGSPVWSSYGMFLGTFGGAVNDQITLTNNIVEHSGTSPLGRGVRLYNYFGSISGNTLKGFYSIQAGDNGGGTILINDNQLFGSSEINNLTAAGTFSNNDLFPSNAYGVGTDAIQLELKNITNASGSLLVKDNTFNNYMNYGIFAGRVNNVSVQGNVFTPDASAAQYRSVTLNTKQRTSAVQSAFVNGIALYSNDFKGNSASGQTGIAFELANFDNVSSIGNVIIGSSANPNTFRGDNAQFVVLNNETGAAPTTGFWGSIYASTKEKVTVSFDASNNLFETSPATLPSAMTLTQLFALEDKIQHKIDDAGLGFVTVKANNAFVTENSYVAPNTTPLIQRGINAAGSTGWTVNVA